MLVFLAAVNAVVEYRRLKRTGAPRPLYILWQRTGAHILPGRAAKGDLAGRQAWIAWDVRWTTFGESTGRVVASGGHGLLLRLDAPIVLAAGDSSAPGVRLESVTFVPWQAEIGYGRAAVSGRLDPPIAAGHGATAVIILYPADT